MTSRMKAFRCIALLLLAAALPLAAVDIHLSVPEGLAGTWDRIVAAHPLPPGTRIQQGGTGGSVFLQRVGESSPLAPGAWKTVERTVLAPAGRLGAAGPEPGKVEPLESIRLPFIAFPVGGLFPGQPGYPLAQEIVLVVDSTDAELLEWFDRVEPATAPAREDLIAWICAVGDIMPARGVDALLLKPGGLEKVFGDTLPLLAGSSLLLGNLEAAATRAGTKAAKSFTFRFDPEALDSFTRAGFTYLSLTNNHTFDFGEKGFLDTLSSLERAGIATSGAGRDDAEAERAVELRAGNSSVRVLSFGAYPVDRMGFDGRRTARAGPEKPGILWLDEESIGRAAAQFRPDALDIVMVHGGEEWTRGPTARQRALYGRLVEAGADVVIGSHSHVVQPIEAVGNGLIAWSLGNFLFPGMEETPGGEDSAILRLGVYRGAVRYVQRIPVRLKGASVRLAPGARVTESAGSGVPMGETGKGDTR